MLFNQPFQKQVQKPHCLGMSDKSGERAEKSASSVPAVRRQCWNVNFTPWPSCTGMTQAAQPSEDVCFRLVLWVSTLSPSFPAAPICQLTVRGRCTEPQRREKCDWASQRSYSCLLTNSIHQSDFTQHWLCDDLSGWGNGYFQLQ